MTTIEKGCEALDVCIEAIPERMDLKVEVLGKVVASAPDTAVIGSNTSSLSITEIGARIGAKARTVGLHFFNPPPVMELLEVVRGLDTAEVTIERSSSRTAKRLGGLAILVNDSPGFATSRLGVIVGAEAIRMLESGVASVEDIDRAMELGYRHPMGPLKLGDLVGLDVRLGILEHLHREGSASSSAPPRCSARWSAPASMGRRASKASTAGAPTAPPSPPSRRPDLRSVGLLQFRSDAQSADSPLATRGGWGVKEQQLPTQWPDDRRFQHTARAPNMIGALEHRFI